MKAARSGLRKPKAAKLTPILSTTSVPTKFCMMVRWQRRAILRVSTASTNHCQSRRHLRFSRATSVPAPIATPTRARGCQKRKMVRNVVGRLTRLRASFGRIGRVSHETIHRSLFIQGRGVLKKERMDQLRSKRRMRGSRHATVSGQSRGQVVDAISIHRTYPGRMVRLSRAQVDESRPTKLFNAEEI